MRSGIYLPEPLLSRNLIKLQMHQYNNFSDLR
jgi:hypothetical protein